MEVERRGELAVTWDPDREYARKFRSIKRGDWVLDPTLTECPFYPISEEASNEAEALALATCFFPDRPEVKDPYWQDAARRLFAYIITKKRPTTAGLAELMAQDHLIDEIVKKSEFKILANSAPGLRSSVISHMNLAAQALRMMPTDNHGRRTFTVKQYCDHPQGWIFLTSNPLYMEAMKPLHTLWLASLIMRTMAMGYRKGRPIVHFIFEEASTITVQEFHTALVRLRKCRCPVVYAIQNYADFQVSLGGRAPTVFSQPFTKIIGRTSHPDSAQLLSRSVGKKKVRKTRLTTTVQPGWFKANQRSYTDIEEDVDLLPVDKITNLDDRELYAIQPGKLSHFQLPIIELADRHPPLMERPMPRLNEPAQTEEESEMDIPLIARLRADQGSETHV